MTNQDRLRDALTYRRRQPGNNPRSGIRANPKQIEPQIQIYKVQVPGIALAYGPQFRIDLFPAYVWRSG